MSVENGTLDESDHDCSVCLNIMTEPSKTPCNHYFCLMCIENFLEYKRNCPYCRRDIPMYFIAKIDKQKQHEIQQANPVMFEKRVEEIKSIRLKEAQKVKLTFLFGNTHEIVNVPGSTNSHSWTAFVKLADEEEDIRKYIRKVVFKLHPTFRNPQREVRSPPFEVSCLGWGVFSIPITIYWQPWLEMAPTEVEHFLNFNGNGKWQSHYIKYDPYLLQKLSQD